MLAVVLGGLIGSLAGNRLSREFKEKLNPIFCICSMEIGISSIVLMQNMLATGLRIARIHDFPIADMIPAMLLVWPISCAWAAWIVPML